MVCAQSVARRAARQLRRPIPMVAALVIAVTAIATAPVPAQAQAAYVPRVVIVVGPAGGATADYLRHARDYAEQARAAGASVTSILAPRATWGRVVAAAQGANIFIYLGHGNGWPSPYGPYQGRTKDGLGLNPYDGAPSSKVVYYGEDVIAAHIRLAPDAVVLLNRLCYASGNGEPGSPEPTWGTAVRRADNFAAGFLRAGAAAVLADGHTSLAYELPMLFGPSRSIAARWSADPDAKGHTRTFDSVRTPGFTVSLDPDRANSGFYRSLVTRADSATGAVRVAAFGGTLRTGATLRTGPGQGAKALGTIADGARIVVRGAPTTDSSGRTWAPVMTRKGTAAWVAAWVTAFSGTARARTTVVLRSAPSTRAARRGSVKAGRRVEVLRSAEDGTSRAWLKVRTSSGRTGWIAAWLTKP